MLNIWNKLSNLLVHAVTEVSSGSFESTENLWCELFYKLEETDTFVYPKSPVVKGNDSVYKTYNSLKKNKEMMMLVNCSKYFWVIDQGKE